MGAYGQVTLGSLRLQAKQRADMVNSPFVSDSEWNQMLTQSYKSLYDLLITSYGNNYYLAQPYVFAAGSSGSISGQGVRFPLPDGLTTIDAVSGLVAAPFYKGLGVDMQLSTTSNPTNWVTLNRFVFNERNRYGLAGTATNAPTYGTYELKYSYQGNTLWLTPIPQGSTFIQLWYVPQPTNLQVTQSGTTVSASSAVTFADVSQLAVGMSAQVLGVSTATYPVASIVGTTVTLTGYTGAGGPAQFQFWNDATVLDGISGWEDMVVVGAAIKATNKQEGSTEALMIEMQAIQQRITEAAADRDAGKPEHVSPPTDRGMPWRGRFWE